MTVCIAAATVGPAGENIFVLCTDRLLSNETLGSDECGLKTHTIGHNWLAMLCGPYYTARLLCQELEDKITRGPAPLSRAEMLERILAAGKVFTSSVLCKKGDHCELLLTGFVGAEPGMIHVMLANKRLDADFVFDKFAIGEGAEMATAMLNYRGYDLMDMPLNKALYLVYEAKKFSESVSSVGQATRMTIHVQFQRPSERAEWLGNELTNAGLDKLEEMRHKFFIQELKDLEAIWPTYFP